MIIGFALEVFSFRVIWSSFGFSEAVKLRFMWMNIRIFEQLLIVSVCFVVAGTSAARPRSFKQVPFVVFFNIFDTFVDVCVGGESLFF